MPDIYTTTKDPLREMTCDSCLGKFAGTSLKNEFVANDRTVVLCDPCKKEVGLA